MVSVETDSIAGLDSHLGYWLRRVSNHVSGAFARSLQAREVSVAEWVVLRQVSQQPGIHATVVSSTLGLTRGAISKILDKLELRGWISRGVDPADARLQLLTLTRKGLRAIPELSAIADQNDKKFFACLTPSEQQTLRHLLVKLVEQNNIQIIPTE